MKERVKKLLLQSAFADHAYARAQEFRFERDYRRRRERYYATVGNDKNAYSSDFGAARARNQIAARGYTVRWRPEGEVHTFAFIPSHWSHQNQIVAALGKLGPVSRFAYNENGFELQKLKTAAPGSAARRSEMLAQMLVELRAAHSERPVDLFFAYSLGWDCTAEVLERIKADFGFPLVNISLDDKNWWDEIERGDPAGGLRNVAPHFDLGWTSATVALPWYLAEGGQAVFLPEGVNTDWFRPLDIQQDVPVSFVGSKFGYRAAIVERLRKAGIKVKVHGDRWPGGQLNNKEMLELFNRSIVNLGLGDMHYSRVLTNLKGRDFEVPATGRGAYITAFNCELAECFDVGREILCYRGEDELIELLRAKLREPDELKQMAARARRRCERDHQWVHRIEKLLRWLGILGSNDAGSKFNGVD